MGKKGFSLSMETIIVLILIIVFLIGGITWITKIFSSRLNEEVINKVCYESVLFNSERRVPGIEAQTVKTKCATKYLTFHKEYAEQEFESNPLDNAATQAVELPDIVYKDKNGKDCRESEDAEACMFRNINKRIADELARCWNNFHKGQRRVFSIYTKSSQCVVCSVIFFDNEIIKDYGDEGPISLINPESEDYSLDLYMRNNNNLYYTGNENYYKYTLDIVHANFDLPYYDYDVNSEYAVVFVALNKAGVPLFTNTVWEKIKELLSDYTPDETEEGNFVNTLYFKPNQEVGTLCEEWA